jgi:hypothetical protein
MSKGLRHYKDGEVRDVVMRRMKNKSGGCGFFAAADYYDKKILPKLGKSEMAKVIALFEETTEEVMEVFENEPVEV